MIPRIHHPVNVAPTQERVTSQCLGINDWTCRDCVTEWCAHDCHKPTGEAS